MKDLSTIILALLAVTSASAEETTFNNVLGSEKVAQIVKEASTSITQAPRDSQRPSTVVEPKLQQKITQRAGDTKLTVKGEDSAKRVIFATRRLREGVIKFFRDYRDFVIQVKEFHDAVLVLTTDELGRFFESVKAAKQCGQLPCDIPPCCGNCDGCETKH